MSKGLISAFFIALLSVSAAGQSRPTRPTAPATHSSGNVIESFEQYRPRSEAYQPQVIPLPPSRIYKTDFVHQAEHIELAEPDPQEIERKVQRANRAERRRIMVGIPREASISPSHQGTWSAVNVQDNARVWALSLSSKGATAVRIHFQDFNLPDGAKLYLYSTAAPDDVEVFEGKGPRDRGDFWSTIFAGDTVNFELIDANGQTPASTPLFHVSDISHLFKDVVGPLGTAGACNLNAACYPAWNTTGDAVGRIAGSEYGGTFVCSGTLLSTQANDFTPFFLTASHCFNSDQLAQTAVVYWLFKSSTCNGTPPNILSVPKTSGATLMNYSSPVDASLLYLTGVVPATIPFAGWSTADPAVSESITGIHHPRGSHRRISFGQELAEDGNYLGYHQVQWSSGITEPGSSGSPLLNANHQVLGQSSLGSSSCTFLQGSDYYGKLSLNFDSLNDTGTSNVLQQGTPDSDGFGNHFTRATAAVLPLPFPQTTLTSKIGRDDWFKITLPAGSWIKLHFNSLTRYPAFSRSEIHFFKGVETSETSLRWDANNDTRLRSDGATSDFYIQVRLAQGAYIPYELGIDYGQPTAPSAELLAPIGKGLYFIYLNASVNTGGMPTKTWFEYSTDSNFANSSTYDYGTVDAIIDTGMLVFTLSPWIDNLSPGTTYFYRLHAENPMGSAVSSTSSIQTLDFFRDAVFSPGSINFGDVVLGDVQTYWAYLENRGTLNLAPTSVNIGDDFTVSSEWTCASYPNPGQTCYFPLVFKPTTAGTHTSTLVVTDHDKTYTLPITGTAILAPLASLEIDWTNQYKIFWVNQPFPIVLTISSRGAMPVQIISADITGDLKEVSRQTNCGSYLPAGDSCTLTLVVSPTHQGLCGSNISVNTDSYGPKSFYYYGVYGLDVQTIPSRPGRRTRTSAVTAPSQATSPSTPKVLQPSSPSTRMIPEKKNGVPVYPKRRSQTKF